MWGPALTKAGAEAIVQCPALRRQGRFVLWASRKALLPGATGHLNNWIVEGNVSFVEFDPGSGRTLAVRLMHASRTNPSASAGTESGKRLSNT